MTIWQLAQEFLAESGTYLTVNEICKRIESSGRYSGSAKRFYGTLYTALLEKSEGYTGGTKKKVFYKSDNPARYGLLEWCDQAHIEAAPKPTSGKELKIKDESDLEVVYRGLNTFKKQRHNQLTNQLLEWANSVGIGVKEGNTYLAFYDALLIDPDSAARQVLVEAKASCNIADVRLAIGQLLDYVRHVPCVDKTDLAILLPEGPPQNVLDFINHVNELIPTRSVFAIWFNLDAYLEFSTDTPPPLFMR